MIAESGPWKDHLFRDAGVIRRLLRTKLDPDNCERELVKMERLVFVTAYAMRKLWEAEKLSTNWNHQKLPCVRFELIGDAPDITNNHKINEFYDLSSPKETSLRPEEYCDRIIHSFVFIPWINEQQCVDAFYFTSDRTKSQCLWLLALEDLARLIRTTAKDYPSSGVRIRTADSGWKTWAGHGAPPSGWLEAAKRDRKK